MSDFSLANAVHFISLPPRARASGGEGGDAGESERSRVGGIFTEEIAPTPIPNPSPPLGFASRGEGSSVRQ
jgi:hypothetical protein